MRKFAALLAGLAMLITASTAVAIPISGSINFMGALDLVGGTSLTTATAIDFMNPALVTTGANGSYAGIPGFPTAGIFSTPAYFQDFVYSPALLTPVTDLWTLTSLGSTFSFDLTSISSITDTALTGTGILHGTGLEDTLGSFILSTQSGDGLLSFSSTAAASAPVPEPSTMVLLGAGLFGLAIYCKRRINNAES